MLSNGRSVIHDVHAFTARAGETQRRTYQPFGRVARSCPFCALTHSSRPSRALRCELLAGILATTITNLLEDIETMAKPATVDIPAFYEHEAVATATATLEALHARREELVTTMTRPVSVDVAAFADVLRRDPTAAYAAPDISPRQSAELRALELAIAGMQDELRAAADTATHEAYAQVAPARRKHAAATAAALEAAIEALEADDELRHGVAHRGYDAPAPLTSVEDVIALRRILDRALGLRG